MKKYVVGEGISFTANGHIFSPNEEISESVFSDKTYFAKMLSEKKILIKDSKNSEEKVEESKETVEVAESTTAKSESKKSKAKK